MSTLQSVEKDPSVILFSGGPCAGKTTIMANQVENLMNRGFWPLVCPEAATLLFNAGIHPKNALFQESIFKTQMHLEDTLRSAAAYVENPVILCDRGLLDSLAYVDRKILDVLAKPYTLEYLRDSRYKAVIHLNTAAKDAEAFYTLENNKARTETLHQAKLLDDRLLDAWNGHPKHIVVSNKGITFDQKKDLALDAVLGVLGYPVPIEDEERYLVSSFFRPNDIKVRYVATEIVQDYLISDVGVSERVRRRGNKGSFVYFHTIKQPIAGTTASVEKEKLISQTEYRSLLRRKDPDCVQIQKMRYTFHAHDLYFELDQFSSHPGLLILEVEKTIKNTVITIPDFIRNFVEKQITGDVTYSNAYLARHVINSVLF